MIHGRYRVKVSGRLLFVDLEEIIRFEACGKSTALFLRTQKEALIITHGIGYHCEQLRYLFLFCRIHESHLVNINEIYSQEGNRIYLKDHTPLPLSRSGRKELNENPNMY